MVEHAAPARHPAAQHSKCGTRNGTRTLLQWFKAYLSDGKAILGQDRNDEKNGHDPGAPRTLRRHRAN